MHLVKMTMKWPSSMIGRGPKMFMYKIHWKLTIRFSQGSWFLVKELVNKNDLEVNKNKKKLAFSGFLLTKI